MWIAGILLLALAMGASAAEEEEKEERVEGQLTTIRVDEMDGRLALVGRLRHELGTILTLEGDVVDGSMFNTKELDGVRLLKVTSLGSRVILRDPIYMRFAWYDGRDVSTLTGHVTVVGYETGAFVGFPAEAFAHVPRVASTDFHFETSFMLLETK
jgi:hypothetical protein